MSDVVIQLVDQILRLQESRRLSNVLPVGWEIMQCHILDTYNLKRLRDLLSTVAEMGRSSDDY